MAVKTLLARGMSLVMVRGQMFSIYFKAVDNCLATDGLVELPDQFFK